MPEADAIRRMFAGVAPRYDFLNHLLSLGIDRRWRREVAGDLALSPKDRVLDLCCGTGDLSLELSRHARAFACDFTWEMLTRAKTKSLDTAMNRTALSPSGVGAALSPMRRGWGPVALKETTPHAMNPKMKLLAADVLRLPFSDDEFDGATIAFGIRNLEDMSAGLREFKRVLRPGGKLAVLEFSHPNHPVLRLPYRAYLAGLLPALGRFVSRRGSAYRYLADSIMRFPEPEALARLLESAGFREVGFRRLTGGIVAIHSGVA